MPRVSFFVLASALSMALCLATVALWFRSYRHLNRLMHRAPDIAGN
jgi:hypothetical protein